MTLNLVSKLVVLIVAFIGLINCSSYPQSSPTQRSQQYSAVVVRSSDQLALWQSDPPTIWKQLVHLSSAKLQNFKQQTTDPIKKSWLELALVSKRNSTHTERLVSQLLLW